MIRSYIPISQENVATGLKPPELIVDYGVDPHMPLGQREIHGFRFLDAVVEYTPIATEDLSLSARRCLALAMLGLDNTKISEKLDMKVTTVRPRVQRGINIVGAKGLDRAGLLYTMSGLQYAEDEEEPHSPPYVTIHKMADHNSRPPAVNNCSPSEMDVLRELARGRSNDGIVEAVNLKLVTVISLLDIIYQQLGTRNRSLLAAHYVISATVPPASPPPDLIDEYKGATDPLRWYNQY